MSGNVWLEDLAEARAIKLDVDGLIRRCTAAALAGRLDEADELKAAVEAKVEELEAIRRRQIARELEAARPRPRRRLRDWFRR